MEILGHPRKSAGASDGERSPPPVSGEGASSCWVRGLHRWLSGRCWRMPLAESVRALGRRWNPLDLAVSAAVDTARNGPLTSRHGDCDDPGFRTSADGLAR